MDEQEPSAALKAYSEQTEAWERLGVLSDAPEYEEWLEQQYSAHLQEIAGWRERWTRKTERVHEIEAELTNLKLRAERLDEQNQRWLEIYKMQTETSQALVGMLEMTSARLKSENYNVSELESRVQKIKANLEQQAMLGDLQSAFGRLQ